MRSYGAGMLTVLSNRIGDVALLIVIYGQERIRVLEA